MDDFYYGDASGADDRDGPEPTHVDYPHHPGYLYDCPACEATCHCPDDVEAVPCVHCADDAPHGAVV